MTRQRGPQAGLGALEPLTDGRERGLPCPPAGPAFVNW